MAVNLDWFYFGCRVPALANEIATSSMRSSIWEISRVSQFEPLTESAETWKKTLPTWLCQVSLRFFLDPENWLFYLATKWMQEVKWWKFREQIPDLVLNSIALKCLEISVKIRVSNILGFHCQFDAVTEILGPAFAGPSWNSNPRSSSKHVSIHQPKTQDLFFGPENCWKLQNGIKLTSWQKNWSELCIQSTKLRGNYLNCVSLSKSSNVLYIFFE